MLLLYRLLLPIAFICALPWFAYQALRHRKYLGNFRQRLGRLPGELRSNGQPAIWLHAVSVGETLAALPLLKELRARFPQHRLVVSTTTDTGQVVARARATEIGIDAVCYFPFDWQFAVRRALAVIKPEVVILMESELWLNFLAECERQAIPTLVANGRISDRSFRRARRLQFLTGHLYEKVTRFAMQSEEDARRAIVLGAPPARVTVTGNIKYDLAEATGNVQAEQLSQQLALTTAPLLIAGSTVEGEEPILLAAFARLKEQPGLSPLRLLLAPRHPQRFDEVARLLAAASFSFVRRSMLDGAASDARHAEIILLDSIGELAGLYRFASVVFVGGSLVPRGGHNILEPARDARPILVGPHTENFRDITREFLRRNAVLQLPETNSEAVTDALLHALTNKSFARQLGDNARQAIVENRGATQRTVQVIVEHLALNGRNPRASANR